MPTLYNQYIYRDGAWRQTGTSSDSVTYQLSLSEDTLTLTGSDGSTSSVSISGGGNEDIFVANYNVTSNADVLSAYNEGKIIFAIYNHVVYGLSSYTVGTDNPTNIFRFYAPDTGLKAKEVLCQLQNGTTTVWQNSLVTSSIGNINSDGDITTTTTISSGDRLVINDESASKLNNSSITFGTNSTQYLANNGTWQNIPTAPVTSVNSKTGAVNLTASDVGALPDDTEIPEKTSDLTNDSNFVSDASYVHTDNNFTDTLEAKLNGIAEGATVDDKTWNGVTLSKNNSNESSNTYIPQVSSASATTAYLATASSTPSGWSIAKYSSGYLFSTTPSASDRSTKVATTAFVSGAIGTAISGVNSFEYEVVQSLPTTNIKDHTIYLVAKTGSTGDVYDEYLYINNAWEHIGSTDVDLSGYVPTTRKVNNKALSSDITLTASDVGALPDSTVIPAQTAKIWTGTCSTASGTAAKVVTLDDATGFSLVDKTKIAVLFQDFYKSGGADTTLNVNNTGAKNVRLSSIAQASSYSSGQISWGNYDIVLFSYHASLDAWIFCGSYVLQREAYNLASNAVPNTRTVNGKALSSNITLNASDVNALPSSTTYVSSVNGNSGAVTITDSDEKVKQVSNYIDPNEHPILFSATTGDSTVTEGVEKYSGRLWFTPYYGLLHSSYIHSKSLYLSSDSSFVSSSNNHIKITPLDSTINNKYTVNLQSKSGTIALTSDIPSATTTTPAMDGTAAVGSETKYAKGDHVHPSDTSKVSKSGDTITGSLTFVNSGLNFKYDENSSAGFSTIGYYGTGDYNTPRLKFTSLKSNSSADSSAHNVVLVGIADPKQNNEAANKQYVDTAVSAKQSKPTITSTTLAVASWSNGVYSFESAYPNASYNIDIEPDGYTITDAQFKAWNEAKIVGNSNGNTIKALGTVPTVAIPIVVRATPK